MIWRDSLELHFSLLRGDGLAGSKGVVKEAEEEEKLGQDVDNIGERRLMVGRVYIYDKERS
jgi:hypothetical protein